MAASRGRHVLSLSRKRKYRHTIEDDKPVRKIPNHSSKARCENEEHIILLGGVDKETNITQPPMATCSIQCNNKDTDVSTVLNLSSDDPVNHRLTDNVISSQCCQLTVIAPVQSSYVSLASTKQLCCDVFNNIKCKKTPDELQVPMDSFIISNRKSEVVELEEHRSTIEEQEGTMEDQEGTMEEQEGTMEEQEGTMEEQGDTMKEQGCIMEDQGDIMKEEGGTMKEEGGTMEEQGGTMKEQGCIMEEQEGTMEEQEGTMEEQGDTMKEQGCIMEDQGDIMKEEGGTMKEEGGTMEEQGCIMEEQGGTLSRSKSEQPLYNRKKYHEVNLLKRSISDTLGKEINVPSRRVCPSYKWIPGTGFTVDAFCYGSIPNCSVYLLSHFHSDHYMGLTRHFHNQIYCSKITSNLVCQQLGVPPSRVYSLSLNEPCVINGVTVILLEANHCPGSVMFLFQLQNGRRILHTGDFRATPSMQQLNVLKDRPIDTLYLDTTYCSSRYDFPSQECVIQFVVDTTLKFLVNNPHTLIVCGTYTIGKEKIFQAIANVLNCDVYVTSEKMRITKCLESVELLKMCNCDADNVYTNKIHVMPINKMNPQALLQYLSAYSKQYKTLLAFKPTGWTFHSNSLSINNLKPKQYGQVTIYGVPYSEHSSFSELRHFVQFLQPTHILSTVGGQLARHKSESQCNEWLKEKKRNKKYKIQPKIDSMFSKR